MESNQLIQQKNGINQIEFWLMEWFVDVLMDGMVYFACSLHKNIHKFMFLITRLLVIGFDSRRHPFHLIKHIN